MDSLLPWLPGLLTSWFPALMVYAILFLPTLGVWVLGGLALCLSSCARAPTRHWSLAQDINIVPWMQVGHKDQSHYSNWQSVCPHDP